MLQWWNLPSKREWSRTASAANTDFPQPAIPYMVTHPGSPFSFQSFCWIAFTSFFLVTKTTGLCGTPPSHSTVLTESRNKYGWTKLQNLWVILLENQDKRGWCLVSKFPRRISKFYKKKKKLGMNFTLPMSHNTKNRSKHIFFKIKTHSGSLHLSLSYTGLLPNPPASFVCVEQWEGPRL